MIFKLYKASELDENQRIQFNNSIKDAIKDYLYVDNTTSSPNRDLLQNYVPTENWQEVNTQITSLSDLEPEKINPNFSPRITEPKTNIFDEENNKKVMQEFARLGGDTTTSEEQ